VHPRDGGISHQLSNCAALGSAIPSFMAAFIFYIIGAMRDCMIDIDFCITKGIFSTSATPAGLS
jgi:hypothetical protein